MVATFAPDVSETGTACANVLALVLALVAGMTGCRSAAPEIVPPKPGDALATTAPALPQAVKIPPGQEVIALVPALRNDSDEPVEITKLRTVPGAGIPDAVQIVQVSLLPPGSPHEPGIYVTFPPVVRSDGRCVRAEVLAPSGTIVEPGEEPTVLVWLRAIGEGRATVNGVRVVYDQDEIGYLQEIAFEPAITVRATDQTSPLTATAGEQACLDEVRPLPGSVRF